MSVHTVRVTATNLSDYMEEALVGEGEPGSEGSEAAPSLVAVPPWLPVMQDLMAALESAAALPGARGLSRDVGYATGLESADRLRAGPLRARTAVEAFLALPYLLAGAGAGPSEFAFDEPAGELTWTFPYGTPLGLASIQDGTAGGPVCAFVEGLVQGWSEGTLGSDLRVAEVKCVATGGDGCRFRSVHLPD